MSKVNVKKTAPVVAAVPAVAVAAAAAAPAVATKKVKAPKAASAPVAAAAPAVVVAATPAAEPVAAAAGVTEFSDFMSKLTQLSTLISSLKTEFRALEKRASRELKTATKASQKRSKRKNTNRAPSGFVKPTLISSELASFLGKTAGTEMARTEVTREINAYIRANQLQDKSNGRRIIADAKLSSLLKLAAGEELTYFNLQRYMSPHFTKSAANVAAAAAAVASA
jgi:chromatin remodeling complex protein RSC6